MDEPVDHGAATLRIVGPGEPSLREGLRPRRVVSVLFDEDVDTWRRGWDRTDSTSPEREAVIAAGDETRSVSVDGVTTARIFPDQQLAYTLLDEPATAEPVRDALATYLDGLTDAAPAVLIDDVTAMKADLDERLQLIETVIGATSAVDGRAVVGCHLTRATAPVVEKLLCTVDMVRLSDPEIVADVERLREGDPTTFGYLRQHWAEAGEGVRACSRNYPRSKQIHGCLSQPETTPRTLGAALSGLASLGVLDTWGQTVGPTRYDLTAHDPARLVRVGVALAVVTDRIALEKRIE